MEVWTQQISLGTSLDKHKQQHKLLNNTLKTMAKHKAIWLNKKKIIWNLWWFWYLVPPLDISSAIQVWAMADADNTSNLKS